MTHVAPSFQASAYSCPHCHAYSEQRWAQLGFSMGAGYNRSPIHTSLCTHCDKYAFWLEHEHLAGSDAFDGRMIVPSQVAAPMPHSDMPASIQQDYEEARLIAQASPRGAAALLRLCVQNLCHSLGESGTNINADIAALVKKGLPVEVQQALDIVRVVGNNAVHPGELSADDVAAVCLTLFSLINHIVEDRISRPKKLADLFSSLPSNSLAQIQRRDNGKF